MDIGDLDHLLAVATAGSLSAAAKRLGVATSTVARRLDALEAALDLRLLDRRTNGARLTPHGQRIAAMARPLVAQASGLADAAAALRAGDRLQPVRVSATGFVVSEVLAPALPMLWRHGAGFPVHLRSEGAVVSIAGGDADLAIRMVRPEGASLLVRRLPEVRLGLFASTAYLAGRPPSALDLKAERLLVYDDSYGRLPELDWLARLDLAAAVRLRTGSTRALLTAARAGAGIALLPGVFAAVTPGLVELPLPIAVPSRTHWLIAHRATRRLPRVAAVHGWIVESFTARFATGFRR